MDARNVFLRNKHVQETQSVFQKAGLDATAFSGCSRDEIGALLTLQQEVLEKSYQDYFSVIAYCNSNCHYAMEYKKRKEMFAAYAAEHAGVASQGAVNAATVMIYKNAMDVELNEVSKYFYVFLATDADRARRTPGRQWSTSPETVFEGYYSGPSGWFSRLFG